MTEQALALCLVLLSCRNEMTDSNSEMTEQKLRKLLIYIIFLSPPYTYWTMDLSPDRGRKSPEQGRALRAWLG